MKELDYRNSKLQKKICLPIVVLKIWFSSRTGFPVNSCAKYLLVWACDALEKAQLDDSIPLYIKASIMFRPKPYVCSAWHGALQPAALLNVPQPCTENPT